MGEHDTTLLMQLYDEEPAMRSKWGDSKDPTTWRGITIDDGRLIKLDLTFCSNLERLPAKVGFFVALTSLSLSIFVHINLD